jgi:hypothetical protein
MDTTRRTVGTTTARRARTLPMLIVAAALVAVLAIAVLAWTPARNAQPNDRPATTFHVRELGPQGHIPKYRTGPRARGPLSTNVQDGAGSSTMILGPPGR